jgi:hypothetical protein
MQIFLIILLAGFYPKLKRRGNLSLNFETFQFKRGFWEIGKLKLKKSMFC